MICNIINRSDPYTCLADDWAVACAAVLCLGNGAYGLASGDRRMPPFTSASAGQVQGWFRLEHGRSLNEVLSKQKSAVAAVLESLSVDSVGERQNYEDACRAITDPVRLAEFQAARHDRRRSSMTDIGRRAAALAAALRKALAKEVAL